MRLPEVEAFVACQEVVYREKYLDVIGLINGLEFDYTSQPTQTEIQYVILLILKNGDGIVPLRIDSIFYPLGGEPVPIGFFDVPQKYLEPGMKNSSTFSFILPESILNGKESVLRHVLTVNGEEINSPLDLPVFIKV